MYESELFYLDTRLLMMLLVLWALYSSGKHQMSKWQAVQGTSMSIITYGAMHESVQARFDLAVDFVGLASNAIHALVNEAMLPSKLNLYDINLY